VAKTLVNHDELQLIGILQILHDVICFKPKLLFQANVCSPSQSVCAEDGKTLASTMAGAPSFDLLCWRSLFWVAKCSSKFSGLAMEFLVVQVWCFFHHLLGG
jgi:hypothetical protein